MKSALLHYWLLNNRGGEKVLAALGEMLPNSEIFTHAFRDRTAKWNGHIVHETFIAKLPFGRSKPQAYLPLMPLAERKLDLSGFDLIISSESGPIKGIRKPKDAKHICYCHTPMRYVWDLYDDYYKSAGIGGKLAMRMFTPYMRREDLKSAEGVDIFVANSKFVANRIWRIYQRQAKVVYPPVAVDSFSGDFEKKDYYLVAGQLVAYKRADLAIEACVRMGRKVRVVGDGVMRRELQRKYVASGLVEFCGHVTDAELRMAYGQAKALIFPGVEDFGIVPVEAQAAGTPAIALGRGGVLETVIDGVTGMFFNNPTVTDVCAAIEEFEARNWDGRLCRENAHHFAINRFMSKMKDVIASCTTCSE